jgi:predicted AlkP superfamily phosphohydrolase/phosphomutase
MRRAVVLGISGLNPDLVSHFIEGLPVLKRMRVQGMWGRLQSTLPAASPVPWITALSGRNPGSFGAWGSRYRDGHAYTLHKEMDSALVDARMRPLYRVLSKLGQRVGAVDLPCTDPVPAIPGGYCVGSGSPGKGGEVGTWPDGFAGDVEKTVGAYGKIALPLHAKRSALDKTSLFTEVKRADEQRFSLVTHLVREKLCDMVMAVIGGTEVVSHLFLRDADSGHALYDAASKDKERLGDYYRFIDAKVGEIAGILDEDTVLCLFSVSSVQRLEGILNLNEWLIDRGYLKLKSYPGAPVSLEEVQVDWSHTKAWAMGGNGQVYINVKGREKQGAVDKNEYNAVLEQLIQDAGNMEASEGKELHVKTFRGEDVHFGAFSELGPDLLLHIDEGRWRSDERVGFGEGTVVNTGNLQEEVLEGVGRDGYISMCGSDFPAAGEMKHVSVLDLAPTIIDIMNLRAPYNTMDYEMEGYSLLQAMGDSSGVEKPGEEKESEEDKVRSRLEALGY